MKTIIVYDTFFGNTEQIAFAVRDALNSNGGAETLRVGDARPQQLTGLDYLIVGSPTRGFRPSKPISGLLKSIPAGGLSGVKVASFDTRMSTADVKPGILGFMVNLFGYAAKPIADALVKKGGELVVPPEGFYVEGSEGPLKEGELERAATWAKLITEKR
jgi:flavodoxin